MKKLFVSADIEGVAGITHFDEASYGGKDYEYFRQQMTREVAAACEGALEAGYDDILIKDAHDTGRNILPTMLPEAARIFRGNASHLYIMMAGLDESFAGAVFTGYHSPAQSPDNPLSHTMNGRNNYIKINGELCSELMLNCLTASMLGVPVYCVTGDLGLCNWIQSVNANILTVPVSQGHGAGSISIHPDLAARRIRETVARAVQQPREDCLYPMPASFSVEINYKQHYDARRASWYPGCRQLDARSVLYETDTYEDVLRLIFFAL